MLYVGADGCQAGWFTITLAEGNDWEVNLFPNIEKLWEQYKDASLILLDIPIGLREEGHDERSCDKDARKLLGPKRGSSVFPAPCRAALHADTYESASEINARMTGRRLSKQAWGIVPKIREVDQLLSATVSARSRIGEIHPELCFWSLAGGRPMNHSKREKAGFSERMDVLLRLCPYAGDIVEYALREYPRSKVARDDILDALAAAITASAIERGLSFIPQRPEFDSKGLPMEMVYHLGGPG